MLTRNAGQSLVVAEDIVMTVLEVPGDQVRLKIAAKLRK
ncbi:MAG: sRNA-binding carbon storage regulator CsrA [Glaciecola sp.]|jgi:sRNA-binding carbon storage regulator CsrA